MKQSIKNTALIALLLLAGSAVAAETRVEFGRYEYQAKCANCHGASAIGDGVLMPYLFRRPADLTALAQRNGGTFPARRVREVIDGRELAPAHGIREMPLWGTEYRIEARDFHGMAPHHPEAFVGSRIEMLVEYLYQLQE